MLLQTSQDNQITGRLAPPVGNREIEREREREREREHYMLNTFSIFVLFLFLFYYYFYFCLFKCALFVSSPAAISLAIQMCSFCLANKAHLNLIEIETERERVLLR